MQKYQDKNDSQRNERHSTAPPIHHHRRRYHRHSYMCSLYIHCYAPINLSATNNVHHLSFAFSLRLILKYERTKCYNYHIVLFRVDRCVVG